MMAHKLIKKFGGSSNVKVVTSRYKLLFYFYFILFFSLWGPGQIVSRTPKSVIQHSGYDM